MIIVDRITQGIHDLQSQRKGKLGSGALIRLGQREWVELRANRDSPKYLSFDESSCPRFMGVAIRLKSVDSFFEITP